MQQKLRYRSVSYLIDARGPICEWSIFPGSGPRDGAAGGVARGSKGQGAFRAANDAAQAAIDAWLAEHPQDESAAG